MITDKKILEEIDACLIEMQRLKGIVETLIENEEKKKADIQEFIRLHFNEENFNINEDKDWHLKDILCVPVNGENVAFRVEHITADKVYFVAVESVGRSDMFAMNQSIDDYLSMMPQSLVDRMVDIEHKANGKIVRKSKLTLLSYANVVKDTGDYRLDGTDDIPFDGLMTEAERCKNFEGETCLYWLDTQNSKDSRYFLFVNYYGYPNYYGDATGADAVVPCFALPRRF